MSGFRRLGPVRSAWVLLATVVSVALLPSRAWSEQLPTVVETPVVTSTPPATDGGAGATDTTTATDTATTDPATSTADPTATGTPTPTDAPTGPAGAGVVELDSGQFTALVAGLGIGVCLAAASLFVQLRSGT